MSEPVYVVRLRRAFHEAKAVYSRRRSVITPNVRCFRTLEEARRYAVSVLPSHNPFDTLALQTGEFEYMDDDADIPVGALTVSAAPDEMTWEYYVRADGTIRRGFFEAPYEGDGEDGGEDAPPDFDAPDSDAPDRIVREDELIEAVRAAGLSPAAPLPNESSVLARWRAWWDATAPAMTAAQRAAVWRVFTDNPYLIVRVEAEI